MNEELFREFIAESLQEVIKKQGGKRRKLGTHASKASAERQERAIHAHGG